MCSSSAGHSLSTPKVTGATRFRWCHDVWPSAKYLFVCVCEQETSVWSVMIWSTRTTCCCAVWTWCMETLSSAPTGRNSLTPPLKVNTHTHTHCRLLPSLRAVSFRIIRPYTWVTADVFRSPCCVPLWRQASGRWSSSLCLGEIVWTSWWSGGGGQRHQAALLQTLHPEAL